MQQVRNLVPRVHQYKKHLLEVFFVLRAVGVTEVLWSENLLLWCIAPKSQVSYSGIA